MFFSRSYGNIAGGIEKMSIDLAQGLTAKGHKVTVISHDSEGAVSFFNWPVEVEWIKLGIGSINSKNNFRTRLKRLHKIRKIVKNAWKVG